MDFLKIYKCQISFYNGDKTKAWNSLNLEAKKHLSSFRPKTKSTAKKEYYKSVKTLTEMNTKYLPFIEKRKFKCYDVDHIVPIHYGYKNGIPFDLIGSFENLRIIPNADNFKKGVKICQLGIDLLARWGFKTRRIQSAQRTITKQVIQNHQKKFNLLYIEANTTTQQHNQPTSTTNKNFQPHYPLNQKHFQNGRQGEGERGIGPIIPEKRHS